MTDPLDLEPIKERLAKATPGPWDANDFARLKCANGTLLMVDRLETEPDHPRFVRLYDAEFCAGARQDIPAMIAKIDRLRAKSAEQDALVECLKSDCRGYQAESERLRVEADRLKKRDEAIQRICRSWREEKPDKLDDNESIGMVDEVCRGEVSPEDSLTSSPP